MSDKRSNRCPKCGHTYTSATHRRKCKGMTNAQIKAQNRARNAKRQNYRRCSPIDWGRVLSRSTITADGAYYDDIRRAREREAQEDQQ